MVQVDTKIQNNKNALVSSPYTYNEIVHYLDSHWKKTQNFIAIKQLDQIFDYPSKKLNIAIISGTNGKSTTIHYMSKLFTEENLTLGAFYTPHISLYNERFSINNTYITNNQFTQIANKVIQAVTTHNIAASTKDILTIMALIFFKEQNVDLAVLENSGTFDIDPVGYFTPQIAAITRIVTEKQEDIHAVITHVTDSLTAHTYFVSADQNKLNLQIMSQLVAKKGASWSMPIRKLAPLKYPFEQLHGRCAALAEKITRIFIDKFSALSQNIQNYDSLLNKPKGLRGRPTLQAKKASELQPSKNIEHFWNNSCTTLASRFQIIQNSHAQIILDNADNLDALKNLFLGIRLLSYKQEYKDISVILSCYDHQFNYDDLIKEIRYYFKRSSGLIAFCPTTPTTIGEKTQSSWDIQKITLMAKTSKIKVKSYNSFKEAYQAITNYTDKNSLIVIAGSTSIITEYNHYIAATQQ